MKNADRDAANWLSYGRTYSEQRFSPLTKINADNAKQLGLAWFATSIPIVASRRRPW
jgi:alcohol dehydrogenase (cytochrome c)/quinohemoprotein ethanol dehydrogenase